MTAYRRVCLVAAAVLLSLGMSATRADAAAREGTIIVVDASDTRRVLSDGEHGTAFSIRLPDDATCPGDSMHDDWRVQTFFVPATDDPGALTYTVAVTGPDGPKDDARVSLYSTEGRPYVQQLLGANAAAGQPGEIPEFPALSFRRLPIDYLPTGDYLMGVACTDAESKTGTYWDTNVHVDSSPNSMRWTVTAAQPKAGNGLGGRPLVIVLVVLGLVLVAAAVVLWQRAARSTARDGVSP